MGIYIFNKDVLFGVLEDAHRRGLQDFGSQIIPDAIGKYAIHGYRFNGYWRDVGTIEAYWQTNMDLIVDLPPFNLYEPDSQVRTPSVDMPPVKIGLTAAITRSLISNGCIINGSVLNSVLSPHVYVEEGARVIDSIIFDDTVIARDALVHHAIIDKECYIAPGCRLGHGDDNTPNTDEPGNLNCGITVVGKGARLPAGLVVGRNCRIEPDVQEADFPDLDLPSGSSVGRQKLLRA
jgi:glucose-1-phosphate adenylyltransferase